MTSKLVHVEPLLFVERPGLTVDRCLHEASIWETREATARYDSFKKTCSDQKNAWLAHAIKLEAQS